MTIGMTQKVNLTGNLVISVTNNRMRVTQDSHPYFFTFVYNDVKSAESAKDKLIHLIKLKNKK